MKKSNVICACSLAFMMASFGALYYVVEKTPQSKTSLSAPPWNETPVSDQISGALGQPPTNTGPK